MQQQEAVYRRIAELTAENKELQRRFTTSTIFNTLLPSIAAAYGSSTQPNSAVMSFFPSGFQPTTAFMQYSLLHLMPSLYSGMMP
ncbi:hypothetical protein TIFTF001_033641 [Ficus carica]|uniref:Uncharacterized protein n=1 Tax=Ficus carica TaxID=3494 RepID=A0AA88J858_FICCA|nr:hypothetical protein TIFTF001_033641 [Ficus carica]